MIAMTKLNQPAVLFELRKPELLLLLSACEYTIQDTSLNEDVLSEYEGLILGLSTTLGMIISEELEEDEVRKHGEL